MGLRVLIWGNGSPARGITRFVWHRGAGKAGLAIACAAACVVLVGGCQLSLVAPVAARVAHIGYLNGSGPSSSGSMASLEAFRSAMAEYGWIEHRNMVLEVRYADGRLDALPVLADELSRLPLDALVAQGANAQVEAKRATNGIPIVAVAGSNFVARGLVDSLAHPGGNLTGVQASVSGSRSSVKQIDMLRAVVPRLTRVAELANPNWESAGTAYPLIESAASAVGIDVLRIDVRARADFEPALTQAHAQNAQALIVPADGSLMNLNAGHIADLARMYRLPSISSFTEPFAEAGFLMTYGPDQRRLAARAAYFVDRILRGARPADLPVEEPLEFEFAINRSTAQALSLSISPDLAAQVTRWFP